MTETKATRTQGAEPGNVEATSRRWIGYTLPLAVFVGMSSLEGHFAAQYVWLYTLKIALVVLTLWLCRRAWQDDIRPTTTPVRVFAMAAVVGLFVLGEWLILDPITPHFGGAQRPGFDPFTLRSEGVRAWFFGIRFFGLVIVAPIVEELFFRSFLLRYLTSPDWETKRVGEYSLGAFFGTAFLFAVSHPEWLAAFVCACAYALLLHRTRSLTAAIVAHATTNFTLGLYIIAAHQWHWW